MSVRVNVRMSKIMRTPIKICARTHVTYATCRTLSATARVAPDLLKAEDMQKIRSWSRIEIDKSCYKLA